MGIANIGRLAGGVSQGINEGQQMALRSARDRRDQEEADLKLRRAKQVEADDLALRAASAPMQDGAGGVAAPITADNRDVGQPDGPTLANRQLQPGTAAQLNSPAGQTDRTADVLRSQGRPTEAIALQRAQASQTKEQEERVRTLVSEGYADTARAMQIGDPAAVRDTFNRQGKFKIKGDLQVKPAEREVPGLGKVPTFDYAGIVVDADGKERPLTVNSHDFAMSLFPYKDKLEIGIKGVEAVSKQDKRLSDAEAAAARAEAAGKTAEAAELRAEAAQMRARNSSGGLDAKTLSEERKQATSLMSDSSRRITETQRAIRDLQRNAVKVRPGSPEEAELNDLRSQLQRHNDEYTSARQRLADIGSKPAAGAPAAAPAKRPDVSKVDGAPKGSTIGKSTPKGWEVKDAAGKLIGYVRD